MKVSTDGILLGAWASAPMAGAILDIGTGTGLIALMTAQRTQGQLPITALELDAEAAAQAVENVAASPWPDSVTVIRGDIRTWREKKGFQQILSNPPYFSNSLKASGTARNLARHNDTLSFAELMQAVDDLAAPSAGFYCILPVASAEQLLVEGEKIGWLPAKRCDVRTGPEKDIIRALLCLEKRVQSCVHSTLTIHSSTGEYSPEFVSLTKAFYLKMPD
nr:methyltransferase [Hahella sp. CCB-MM4]